MNAIHKMHLASKHWSDDSSVPVSNPKLKRPRFDDGSWLIGRRENLNPSAGLLNFDALFPDPVQHLTAREFAMAILHGNIPLGWKKSDALTLHFTTIKRYLYKIRSFYRFIGTRGVKLISEVSDEMVLEYTRSLSHLPAAAQGDYLSPLRLLQATSDLLSMDRLSCTPSLLKSPGVRDHGGENKTPRIPENVIRPLFLWAKHYIDHFADDIITAVYLREIGQRRLVAKRVRQKGLLGLVARQKVASIALAHFGNELPVLPAEANGGPASADEDFGRLVEGKSAHRQLASAAAAAERPAAPVREVVRRLVVPPGAKQTWRSRFTSPETNLEARNLVAACYIVCAYLSGMRDSEVMAMRLHCLRELIDKNDAVIRRYVVSKEYKFNGSEGLSRAWVVVEPVAKAVKILSQVSYFARAEAASDLLFVMPQSAVEGKSVSISNDLIRIYIADFIGHINSQLVPRHKSALFPRIPIETFRPITTRMFRRTIAWFIANQPFGIVAGMIQFGHLGVQSIEGYAGTSASGFRKELEYELELARTADIRATYQRYVGGEKVAGPIGDELHADFDHVTAELAKIKGRIATDADIDGLLKHRAIQLWPMLLNDCFFDPSRALCKPKEGLAKRPMPSGNHCEPHECKNSCWKKKHLEPWQNLVAEVDRRSKINSLPQAQRDIQAYQRRKFIKVIDAIKDASGGACQDV